MRVPIRKPGKYTHDKTDTHFTEEKLNELKNELERLKKVSRPNAAAEMKRTQEMGDLSENAAYQIAKGRLRGINERISDLESMIHAAVIIKTGKNSGTVRLGSKVTVESNGVQKTYQILGSSETDPFRGIISHNSPIGLALLGHRVGDKVMYKAKDKIIECQIISIE